MQVTGTGTQTKRASFGQARREIVAHVNGVKLCFETSAIRAHPVILLSHGAGNAMLYWEDAFCELLASGSRFVVRYTSGGDV